MKLLATLSCLVVATNAITVTVSSSGGTAMSDLQYGLMFEDINHSGDGGIYAELIQTRAFQGDNITAAALSPWTAIGGATLTLQSTSPALSSALPSSVNVKGSANTAIGISNPGYWGIEVKPQTYTGSFYVMGAYTGSFTAKLQSSSGTVYASATIASKSVAGSWTEHTFTLTPTTTASSVSNVFELTFTPTSSSTSLNFNLISLFPPTYNNRANGMRVDLMTALKNLNPSFLRLPGGNNLEGGQWGNWWNWTATIGPLSQRPGRTGDWGYVNTNGLGLIEYMYWCQDLGMEPVLAIWSGLYLDGVVLSESALEPYVTDAMNELEFLMGDSSTTWGAKRIALGYTDPFQINYVEIGNEDNLNSGLSTYNSYRFALFYNAIIAKYPSMKIIASTTAWTDQLGSSLGDDHEYNTPDIFAGEFDHFDSVSTGHQYLVGEYAAVQANLATNTGTNWSAAFEAYPWWIGSVSEAIFELGAEKNSNKIIGLSYAPLLQNLNSYEWHPDLISFSADSSQTTLSTSYHQIQLLSNNRMTTLLPSTNSASYGPAYWVTGENSDTGAYLFKAAVYNTSSSQAFTVSFPSRASGSTATLTVLTAPGPYSSNTPGSSNVVSSAVSTVTATSSGFSFSLPEWSVAVLSSGSGTGSGSGSGTTTTSATALSTSTKTSSSSSSTATTVAEWGQCGGDGYTGSTACVSGTTCTYSNEYYSQCLPS